MPSAVLNLPGAGINPDSATLHTRQFAEGALPLRGAFQIWTVTVKNLLNTQRSLTIKFGDQAGRVRLVDEANIPVLGQLAGVFIKVQDGSLQFVVDGQATYRLNAQRSVNFAFVFDLPIGTAGRLALLDFPITAFPSIYTNTKAVTPPTLLSEDGMHIVPSYVCSTPPIAVEVPDFLTGKRDEKMLSATNGELLAVGLVLSSPMDEIILKDTKLEVSGGRRYEPVQFRHYYGRFSAWNPDHLSLGTSFTVKFIFNQAEFKAPINIASGIITGHEYHLTESPGQEVGALFVFDIPEGSERLQLKIQGLPPISVQENCITATSSSTSEAAFQATPTPTRTYSIATYSEILQTYPKDVRLCKTELSIVDVSDDGQWSMRGAVETFGGKDQFQCYFTFW
ncbi:hypothetical protein KFU94_30910 [Chloroflexi bacterium TSY]|nr:hypothetical protein [Chloroflexi bacterium TSY]